MLLNNIFDQPVALHQPMIKRPTVRLAIASFSACMALILSACSETLPYHARAQVLHAFPHDSAAFTQGLLFDGSTLYECTGLYGESTLRRVDLETGKVLQMRQLPDDYFGEGCTIWDDSIIQLTWKAGVGFVYDKETFAIRHQFDYPGEGWGLTHDGSRLIMSDGTSYLRFLDPDTLQEVRSIQALDKGEPIKHLNELEWIDGQVWANVWQTTQIVRVDPKTGQVLGWIDCSALAEQEPRGVLNGIATRGHQFFVTGKKWTAIYQVEIRPAESH